MTTPTMAAPGTDPLDFARPEVQAAIGDLTQAEQLLTALEERIRDGDPGVQPAELADARQVVEFARLRVDAARRAAQRREHDERVGQYTEVGALARAVDTTADQRIVDAFTDAVTALSRLWELAGDRSKKVRDVASRAAHAVVTADQHGERGQLRAAGIHNAGVAGLGNAATVAVIPETGDGYRLTDLPAREVLSAALGRVAQVTEQELSSLDPRVALAATARVFPAVAAASPAKGATDAA